MDRLEQLITFIHKLTSDIRLKPSHLSLCLALCHAWMRSNFQNIFQVSRSKLMAASRIQSRATYHKVMKELQAFGYVKYTPSYHPVKGSSVGLVILFLEAIKVISWCKVNKISIKVRSSAGQGHQASVQGRPLPCRHITKVKEAIQCMCTIK